MVDGAVENFREVVEIDRNRPDFSNGRPNVEYDCPMTLLLAEAEIFHAGIDTIGRLNWEIEALARRDVASLREPTLLHIVMRALLMVA